MCICMNGVFYGISVDNYVYVVCMCIGFCMFTNIYV